MAATVALEKDKVLRLVKANGAYDKLIFGVGWDARKGTKGELQADIDLSVLVFDVKGEIKEIVEATNMESSDGAVVHSGDSQTGAGRGDDEWVSISLSKLAGDVAMLIFALTSYTAVKISSVDNVFAHLVDVSDPVDHVEVASFDITHAESNDADTALVVCKLFRERHRRPGAAPAWRLQALGRTHTAPDSSALVKLMEDHVARLDAKVLTLQKGDSVFFDGPESVIVGVSWCTRSGVYAPYSLAALVFDKKGVLIDTIGEGGSAETNDGSICRLGPGPAVGTSGLTKASINNAAVDDDHERMTVRLNALSRTSAAVVFVLRARPPSDEDNELGPASAAGVGVGRSASETSTAKQPTTLSDFDFACVHLVNASRRELAEIARFEVEEETNAAGFILCCLYRDVGGKWTMRAAGIETHTVDGATIAATSHELLVNAKPKSLAIRKGDVVTFEGPRKVMVEMEWAAAVAKPTVRGFCMVVSESGELVSVVDKDKPKDTTHSLEHRSGGTEKESFELVLANVPASATTLVFGICAYDSSLGRRGNLVNRAALRLVNSTSKPMRDVAVFTHAVSGDDQALVMGLLFRDGSGPTKWTMKALGETVVATSHAHALPLMERHLNSALPRTLRLSRGDVVSFKGPHVAAINIEWHGNSAPLPVANAEATLFDMQGNVLESVSGSNRSACRGAVSFDSLNDADANTDGASVVFLLSRLTEQVFTVVFTLAPSEGFDLGAFDRVTVTLVDRDGGGTRPIANFSFDDTDRCHEDTTAIVATLFRGDEPGKWKLQAKGSYVTGAVVSGLQEAAAAASSLRTVVNVDSITVRKGDVLSFEGPTRLTLNVDWEPLAGKEHDLSAAVAAVDAQGGVAEVVADFAESNSRDGAISRVLPTADASPSSQSFVVRLREVAPETNCLLVMVTAIGRGRNIGSATGVRASVVDSSGGVEREICSFSQATSGTPGASGTTCLLLLLYRDEMTPTDRRWKLKALGAAVGGDSVQRAVDAWARNQQNASAPKRILLNRGDVLSFAGPTRVYLGVGWDSIPGAPVSAAQMEVWCLLLNEADDVVAVVSATEPTHSAVKLVGGSTGRTSSRRRGDNETLQINLAEMPPSVHSLLLVLTAAPDCSAILATYCRLINASSSPKREIAMFDTEAQGSHTAIVQAVLLRDPLVPKGWKVRALGNRASGSSPSAFVAHMQRAAGGGAIATKSLDLHMGDVVLFDGSHKAVVSVSWAAAAGAAVGVACLTFTPDDNLIATVDSSQPSSTDGSVVHSALGEENLEKSNASMNDEGAGVATRHHVGGTSEESVTVNLAALSPRVKILVFCLTAFGSSFEGVTRARVTLSDATMSSALREIARYDQGSDAVGGRHDAIILCMLFRDAETGKWKFKAVRETAEGGNSAAIVTHIQAKIREHTPKTLMLSKGEVVSFNGSQKIVLGFGWEVSMAPPSASPAPPPTGEGVTALALLFTRDGTLIEAVTEDEPTAAGECVTHSSRSGAADRHGDAQLITVDLEHVPLDTAHVFFVLSAPTTQEFSIVEHAYMRMLDATAVPEREICKFDLIRGGGLTPTAPGIPGTGGRTQGALLLAHLYRETERTDRWRLRAIGAPVSDNSVEAMGATIEPFLGLSNGGCCSVM